MNGYTLDTNIISRLLTGPRKLQERVSKRIARATLLGIPVTFSVLVYYELRRGLLHAGLETELAALSEFCDSYEVLPCDIPTLDRACDLWCFLRKKFGNPTNKDIDIILAATGLVHDMVVVTDNIRDFDRIPDLNFENWLLET